MTVCVMDESIEAIKHFFKTKRAYIGTAGQFISSVATSTVNLVLANMTG